MVSITALSFIATAYAATFTVTVGANGRRSFVPAITDVQVGDIVTFKFAAGGHNVIQSASASSCAAAPGAFFAFPSASSFGSTGSSYNYTVVAPTSGESLFFYCRPHCQGGMIGQLRVKPATKPNQIIEVGREGNTFTPARTRVRLGETVTFYFPAVKHDTVQSDQQFGCLPATQSKGFAFKPTSTDLLAFNYTVVAPGNGASSIFFYCTPHCTANMFGQLDIIDLESTVSVPVATSTTIAVPTPTVPVPATKPVQTIEVGRTGNRFGYVNPSTPVKVKAGDVINFQFFSSTRHNAVQSDKRGSCTESVQVGHFRINPTSTQLSFNYTVMPPANGATSIYFFCGPHCNGGMVGQLDYAL